MSTSPRPRLVTPAEPAAVYAPEAEERVLASVFRDNQALAKVRHTLEAEDFSRLTHRMIWEAMVALHDRGEGIDCVTLNAEMASRGTWEECSQLVWRIDGALPTAAHIDHYARIVRAANFRRSAVATGERIKALAGDPALSEEQLAERMMTLVSEATSDRAEDGPTNARSAALAELRAIERRERSHRVTTGLIDLDSLTRGLRPEQLWLLAARPSTGKTALALQIAAHAAREGAVYFASLEMSVGQLSQRLLAARSGVPLDALDSERLSPEDAQRLCDALTDMPEGLHIDDAPKSTPNLIKQRARAYGDKLRLIVVDYIQLLRANETFKTDTSESVVARVSSECKAVAKDLGVPVLALAQLNRGPEKRDDRRPRLGDLRGSGALEQDADVVAFLHREHMPMQRRHYVEEPVAEIEILVAKNRDGKVGTVKTWFRGEHMRFDNYA